MIAKMGSNQSRIGPTFFTVVSPTVEPVAKAVIRITPTNGRTRLKMRVLKAFCMDIISLAPYEGRRPLKQRNYTLSFTLNLYTHNSVMGFYIISLNMISGYMNLFFSCRHILYQFKAEGLLNTLTSYILIIAYNIIASQ